MPRRAASASASATAPPSAPTCCTSRCGPSHPPVALRPAGAAAHRHRRAARHHPADDADRARPRPSPMALARRVDRLGAARPARATPLPTSPRRYSAGDLTSPPHDYGQRRARRRRARARRLGAGARATGWRSCRATARAWKRSCRAWSRACWSSTGTAALQLVNRAAQADAARRRRRRRAAPYLEVIRHPDIAAQLATALRRRRRRQPRAGAVARPGTHVRRARGAGRRRRRRRRRARAARHHRPAPRRSDPPRLRRQRLARAAHAADGHPRLRRGAARRAGRCRRTRAASSRSSDARARAWSGWSRTCCAWRGSTRGRRRSNWRACDMRQIFRGVVADLEPTIEAKHQRVTIDVVARRRQRRGRPGQAARHRAQPGRERRQLLARRTPTSVSRPRRRTGRLVDYRRRLRPRHSAGRT